MLKFNRRSSPLVSAPYSEMYNKQKSIKTSEENGIFLCFNICCIVLLNSASSEVSFYVINNIIPDRATTCQAQFYMSD